MRAQRIDVVVIGAGQAGLAISQNLSARNVDHIVLDRGAVGERWRSERWASLRLLTPNWMTRLPGWHFDGNDPEGFMHKDALVAMLRRYARSFAAPVREFTEVRAVTRDRGGFRVRTTGQTFRARAVVIASGACDVPNVPAMAARLSQRIHQVTTRNYVHPGDLPEGGVLVVGASATGVQLADEIQRSGRPVTLAVGQHVALPRRYLGRDIMRWLDEVGLLTAPRDLRVANDRVLALPSMQLIGSPEGRDVGLGALADAGVRLAGRLIAIDGNVAGFADSLRRDVEAARLGTDRVLGQIDSFASTRGFPVEGLAANRTWFPVPDAPPETLDLAAEGIRTVVWATGFRRDYGWLKLPALAGGELIQTGGVTPIPGLHALGLPFMRSRNSAFIDGVGADAAHIMSRIEGQLGLRSLAAE